MRFGVLVLLNVRLGVRLGVRFPNTASRHKHIKEYIDSRK